MPDKITKLTPAQTARFGEWSKKWVNIGLSTAPANFESAEVAALKIYDLLKLERPLVVLRLSSPYGAVVGGVLALEVLKKLKIKKVWSQVGSQVGSQVRSQVESQVESQVRSQVWSQVESQAYYNLYHGAFWASWGAYVSFLRDVCGWTNSILSRFELEETLIKSCNYVWWHENVLAISDRPSVLNRDREGRLHCETGPSIAYRDGWSLWHWHGVAVPSEWITNRKKLSPKTALTHTNIEQRRAALEIVGWPRVLRELKAKVIDEHSDPQYGSLLEVKLPDLDNKSKFLTAQCGTKREFAIGVPPEINTVAQAQAWLTGLPENEFEFPPVRT